MKLTKVFEVVRFDGEQDTPTVRYRLVTFLPERGASRDQVGQARRLFGQADVVTFGCENPYCPDATCDDRECRTHVWQLRADVERDRKARRAILEAPLSGREGTAAQNTERDPWEGIKSTLKVQRSNTGRQSTVVHHRGASPVVGLRPVEMDVQQALKVAGQAADAMAREGEYRSASRSVKLAYGALERANESGDARRVKRAIKRLSEARARYVVAHSRRLSLVDRERVSAGAMALCAFLARDRVTTTRIRVGYGKHGHDLSRAVVIPQTLGVIPLAAGSDTLQGSSARMWARNPVRTGLGTVNRHAEMVRDEQAIGAPSHATAPAYAHAFGTRWLYAASTTDGMVWFGHHLLDRPEPPARKRTILAARTLAACEVTDREQVARLLAPVAPKQRVEMVSGDRRVAVSLSVGGRWSVRGLKGLDFKAQPRTIAAATDAALAALQLSA